MNLVLLTVRLIYLSVRIDSPRLSSLADDMACKFFNYLMTCCTRITYCLASLVTIERMYSSVFLTAQWFKSPKIARRLIVSIILFVLLSDIHELICIYSLSYNEDRLVTICVIEFPSNHRTTMKLIYQTVPIIHSMVPLLINLLCTLVIMWIIIEHKMNLHREKSGLNSDKLADSSLS